MVLSSCHRFSILSVQVFATIECYHRFALKYSVEFGSVIIYRIFQFLSTMVDMLASVLLYVIDSGIRFLLLFSLFVKSSFLSILPTFLICSSRTSSLYCLSRNFYLMIAQFLFYSVVLEQIVFSLKA